MKCEVSKPIDGRISKTIDHGHGRCDLLAETSFSCDIKWHSLIIVVVRSSIKSATSVVKCAAAAYDMFISLLRIG